MSLIFLEFHLREFTLYTGFYVLLHTVMLLGLIHVVCVSSQSLLVAEYYFTIEIYHDSFICLPIDGHFGYLQPLPPMTKTVLNISLKVLLWTYVFIYLE